MRIRQSQSLRAFTRVEFAVILGILVLAAGVLVPASRRSMPIPARVTCINQMKQIALAFRMWSNDNSDLFPWLVSTNAMATNGPGTLELIPLMVPAVHFRAISNELGTVKLLRCPADIERLWATNWSTFTRSNLSYFVNVNADEACPLSILIGDRNLMINTSPVKPGLALITTNQNLGWDKTMHNECGNIGLSDGSVQQVTASALVQLFQSSPLATNRLVIP